MPQNLARVLDGDLCAGCGLCGALAGAEALQIDIDTEGYFRPHATGTVPAETDAQIGRVCPGLALRLETEETRDDPLWGPIVSCRTGHATDPALRHHASSGAGLSAVLIHLLESKAVDAVLQTAADPARPIGNRTVISETAEEIYAAAGSRYAPSAPLAGIEEYLQGSRRLAFVGKPCDVAALKALGREDPRVAQTFPVTISFFCGGVPSLAGAREVLSKLGMAETEVATFKYRGDGWPGQATAVGTSGESASMSYADSWGGILNHWVQWRCKLCADGVGSFADIVCADAWECDARGYPILEERDGVSLIIARTAEGEAILAATEAAGCLVTAPLAPEAIAPMQPGQVHRKSFLTARLMAARLMRRPVPAYEGLKLREAARPVSSGRLARHFLGTLKRLLRPRRR